MTTQIIKLDCVQCGCEVEVEVAMDSYGHHAVISVRCESGCELSLQEQFDLEVEALAIVEEW